MKRTIVIGDLHGCRDPFLRLLAKIDPVPGRDKIIFLGDYVNRGPHSKELLTELILLKKKMPHTTFLKGNHEFMLLDYLQGRRKDLFFSAGGATTIRSYDADITDHTSLKAALPPTHRRFLENLLPYWQDENFIYVHAGLEPGRHLSQQRQEWLYWADREKFINTTFNLSKRIIFGHFAQKKPLIMADKIGIDGGAVYGGFLTCLILPDLQFLQVTSPQYW
ncbi:MAG: metallophosphoesterase family protein [Deltaproteobacteria bacterium]|jgi:serine/threonine protein phosphatase 1|nr:metallophosphoesterase family protein [Deltaproteobacteria bacterium]